MTIIITTKEHHHILGWDLKKTDASSLGWIKITLHNLL
jgi:hypothetical protein